MSQLKRPAEYAVDQQICKSLRSIRQFAFRPSSRSETLCYFRSLFLCTNNSGAEPARLNRGLKAPGGTLEVRSPDSGPCPRFKSPFIQVSAVTSAHGFPLGCFCFPLAAQGVARAILLTRRPPAFCRLTWACVGNRFGLRGRLFVSLGAFIS